MNSPLPRLLVEERRRLIVGLVEQHGKVTVDDLAALFDISPVTIRSDLDALARSATIVRSHGGALPALVEPEDSPLSTKEMRRDGKKWRIGQAAARLVKDGETIILDSGSTTLEIARAIRQRKLNELTVITNGLQIAFELSAISFIRVIMLGGLLQPSSLSFAGLGAEQLLSQLSIDRLFLGVDGIDPEVGVTTLDPQEALLNALMIRVSREVVGVFDVSKLGQRSLSVIAPVSALNIAITEKKANAKFVQAMTDKGIRVVLV
jgi:DeoR family transcriptional regulator of aga operon